MITKFDDNGLTAGWSNQIVAINAIDTPAPQGCLYQTRYALNHTIFSKALGSTRSRPQDQNMLCTPEDTNFPPNIYTRQLLAEVACIIFSECHALYPSSTSSCSYQKVLQ